jgi:hypothetical protein
VMQYDDILYIGQSRNIRERWRGNGHHKSVEVMNMENIFIRFTPSDGRPLLVQEAEWINQYLPPLNGKVSRVIRVVDRVIERVADHQVKFFLSDKFQNKIDTIHLIGWLLIYPVSFALYFFLSGTVYEKIDTLGRIYTYVMTPFLLFILGVYVARRNAVKEVERYNELLDYIASGEK